MIAAYLRHGRSSMSYALQREEVESLLEPDGISDFEWFIDNANGVAAERPALDRLRKSVAAGEVDAVYCCSQTRLSRDPEVAGELVDLCQIMATRLVFADAAD